MTNVKHSTGKQLVMLSGLKFWNQAISLVKTMMISRMFSLTQYGIYTKIIMILDFAFSIIVLNLPSSATYFISKSNDNQSRKNFIYTFYILCTIVGIIMGIVLFFLAHPLGVMLNSPEIVHYRWFLCITPLFQIICKATSYVLTSLGKSNEAVKISFLSSVLLLISLFVSYNFTNSFVLCLSLMLVVELIETVIGYRVCLNYVGGIRGIINKLVTFQRGLVIKIYKYIIPVGLSSVVLIVNTRIDKLLVSITSDTEFYAIYANASKELPVAAISVAISSVIIPKLVKLLKENKVNGAVNVWRNTLTLVSVFSLLLLAGTLLYAPEVISIIYSEKFLAGLDIFRIYLMMIPFHCIAFTFLLSATDNTKYILYSSILSLMVNIALDVILLNIIGYIGLGIATVIATLLSTFLQLFYSARVLNISVKQLIPTKELIKVSLINIIFMFVFSIVTKVCPLDLIIGNIVEAVFLGGVWSCIYLIIVRNVLKNAWKGINKEY